jgi:hypothetical protein
VSYRNGILTFAYTGTGKGVDIRNPWSIHPDYTSVIVDSFKRAGEQAFLGKASYDFRRFGWDRISAYVLWVHGWDAVDPITKLPIFQKDEYDFALQWRPKKGLLEGMSFQASYSYVGARGGGASGYPINDFRLIVN